MHLRPRAWTAAPGIGYIELFVVAESVRLVSPAVAIHRTFIASASPTLPGGQRELEADFHFFSAGLFVGKSPPGVGRVGYRGKQPSLAWLPMHDGQLCAWSGLTAE